MGLRLLLSIFFVVIVNALSEAPRERSPAILHLQGNEWASGFHERRLARSCHQRILLKPRRTSHTSPGSHASRRLARRLFEEIDGLEPGTWHHLTRVGIDIAEIRCGEDVEETVALIKEKLGDELDFIELDEQIYTPLQSAVVDPSWAQQWGPQRVGLFNAWQQLEALDVTPSEVVVALIDTGFNFQHEDIQGRVWVNEGEIAGNGIDDDGNGFVDDVNGFNFVANNGRPDDDGGHGTHNAGIIAANLNNLGVAGAAGRNQMVKLMIVKALTPSGGYKSDAINALNYAMAMGAEISSNSWGGHTESLALQQAIQIAMEAGHLFVSAAGNDNANADASPFYPCVYPHVLCVAASDDQEQFTFFTNFGVESVELVAPGQSILSTYLGNSEYAVLTGTSFGTSMVAGAAALLFSWLRSATNTVKSVEDIRWLLLETAEKLSWTEGYVGNGMLDVDAAVEQALSGVAFSWSVGPWSLCRRASCISLQGVRLRNVSCVSADGTEVETSKCSDEPTCQDTLRSWRDSYDATCSIYAAYNWCTSTGNYASGWNSDWGSFADYARDGLDATQVCCACGSGVIEASNVPFASQECPEPISGPDANYDGLDDCIVPVVSTTATSVTETSITDTTVTITTVTGTTQTRTSTTSVTQTSSTVTSSTATTKTDTSTTFSTSLTSTSSTETTYSTISRTSTSTVTQTSSTATSTSKTRTATSSTTYTRSTSTSSTFTVTTSTSVSTSITSSITSSSSVTATSSTTSSETRTSSITTTSSATRTSSTTQTSTVSSTTTGTTTSTSKTWTTSTSSSYTSTSSTTSTTTLTVRLAAPVGTTDYVRSTLLLVGSNQTPAGIDDALAVALATSFQMQRSSVEVISVKPAVAAMFGSVGRRLTPEDVKSVDFRRAQRVAPSLEPALETDFQILLPEGSDLTVDEALEAIHSVRQDPGPLLPVLGQVMEDYGLARSENVTLRFTTPSAARAESVFVASLWGECAGGAICSTLLVPLRYRDVWCARVDDLAKAEPDGFCAGARPRTAEPCPDTMERPPPCGWQISNWSTCMATNEICNGEGIQTRKANCLAIPPDDCGAEPLTQRECQCVMDTSLTYGPSVAVASEDLDSSIFVVLPSILGGVVGLVCCCLCLLCLCSRRGKKVDVMDARSETAEVPSTPTTPSRLAVADLLAECEKRQISTKGCLERSDLEDLLKESETSEPHVLREVARSSSSLTSKDRPSSPMSPSRIQHLPSAKVEEEQEDVAVPCVEKPRPSPSGNSEVSTRHSGSPLSSKSSTGLERLPSTPDSGAATVSPVQPATPAPAAPAGPKPVTLDAPAAPAPEAPMASAPAMLATEPAAPSAKRSSSKKAKNSSKPPPLVPELVDAPMEAPATRPSTSQLRKTATWTSNVSTPSSSRSPTRSRSTLGQLAETSRPPSSLRRSRSSPMASTSTSSMRPTTAPSPQGSRHR